MSNFFRKDLNLGQKWGHRLLSIIFYGLFIVCLFIVGKSAIFDGGIRPIHEVKSSLAQKITSEVKSIRELANPGEILYRGIPYGINLFFFWTYGDGKYQGLVKEIYNNQDDTLDGVFCSERLYTQINDVIKRTGISKFYIKEINNYLKPISTKITTEYIKTNNIKCILIDSFGDENKFLNPSIGQEYQNNYYFYERTGFSALLNILEIITRIITIVVILAIPFSLLLLIYYKIIIYIIYGNNNKRR